MGKKKYRKEEIEEGKKKIEARLEWWAREVRGRGADAIKKQVKYCKNAHQDVLKYLDTLVGVEV